MREVLFRLRIIVQAKNFLNGLNKTHAGFAGVKQNSPAEIIYLYKSNDNDYLN